MNISLDFLKNKGFDVGDIVRIDSILGIVIKDINGDYNILSIEESKPHKLEKGELWSGRFMSKEELEEKTGIELIRKSKDVKINIE